MSPTPVHKCKTLAYEKTTVFQSGSLCFFLLHNTVPSSWAVRHTEEPRIPNLRTIFGHCTQGGVLSHSSSLGLLTCLGTVRVPHAAVLSRLSSPSVAGSAATLVCRWGHKATEPLGQLSCCWAGLAGWAQSTYTGLKAEGRELQEDHGFPQRSNKSMYLLTGLSSSHLEYSGL